MIGIDKQTQDADTTVTICLGGFQTAADLLANLSGRNYSWQAVQGLWRREQEHPGTNGFPDRKTYNINGHTKYYFDMKDIREWYTTTHR